MPATSRAPAPVVLNVAPGAGAAVVDPVAYLMASAKLGELRSWARANRYQADLICKRAGVVAFGERRARSRLDTEPAGAWWVCRCGRHFDRHSRRRHPAGGHFEYTCGYTESGRFESQLLPDLNYDPERGLYAPAGAM